MALHANEVLELSHLLDEALALDPSKRAVWLAALSEQRPAQAARIGDMLADYERPLDTGPLAGLPALDAVESSLATGDRVGPYRLLRLIGSGGMGSVWLADRVDGAFTRQVALKLPRVAWSDGLAQRMAREVRIGALLEHPNIARLYDAGLDEKGRPFIAIEFIDGVPIDLWVRQQRLDTRQTLALFVQVVRAVAYAHSRLIVHRDLKPSNVIVSADGQAHLLDFGIAKLLDDGDASLTRELGRPMTPRYASPEQVTGTPITIASDIYSLGVVLYELLTGSLPHVSRRGSPDSVEQAILAGDAPAASRIATDKAQARALRGEVDAILARAMHREPERRYATADALAQDIERHLRGEPVSARPDSTAYRVSKLVRRHWVGITASAVVVVAVVAGSGFAALQAARATRAAERERMVKAFVVDMFRLNSGTGATVPARQTGSAPSLLESGAGLIQSRFADQPQLQAELFSAVAGVLSDMGAFKLASDYAMRRVEALLRINAPRVELARAECALGQSLFDERRFAEAESRVTQALQWSEGEPALRLEALVLLARIHAARAQFAETEAALVEVESKLPARDLAPSVAAAWALTLRARLLDASNRLDQALPLYEQAIDTAVRSEGALSTTAISIRLGLAYRLAHTPYAKPAEEHFDAAVEALHHLGGAHAVRAAFETAAFARHRYVGWQQTTAAEALRRIAESRTALLHSGLTLPDWYLPEVDFWFGEVSSLHGDIATALPLLEANSAVLAGRLDSLQSRLEVANAEGLGLMYAGRHEEADRLLREALRLRLEQGGAPHPYDVFRYTAIAMNLVMAGRLPEANAVLDAVPDAGLMQGGASDPERYRRIVVQERARIRLSSGDAAGALGMLEAAAPAAEDQLAGPWYRELLGEALCATSRRAAGLALLERQVSDAEHGDDHPNAPWRARMHAIAGACALAVGQREVALRHAIRARAAFTAQPGVSAYYSAPLWNLEKALRVTSSSA